MLQVQHGASPFVLCVVLQRVSHFTPKNDSAFDIYLSAIHNRMKSIGFLSFVLLGVCLAEDFSLGPNNWTWISGVSNYSYVLLPGEYNDDSATIFNTYISNISFVAAGHVIFNNVSLTISTNQSILLKGISFYNTTIQTTSDLSSVSQCLFNNSTWTDDTATSTIISCDFTDATLQTENNTLSVSHSQFTRGHASFNSSALTLDDCNFHALSITVSVSKSVVIIDSTFEGDSDRDVDWVMPADLLVRNVTMMRGLHSNFQTNLPVTVLIDNSTIGHWMDDSSSPRYSITFRNHSTISVDRIAHSDLYRLTLEESQVSFAKLFTLSSLSLDFTPDNSTNLWTMISLVQTQLYWQNIAQWPSSLSSTISTVTMVRVYVDIIPASFLPPYSLKTLSVKNGEIGGSFPAWTSLRTLELIDTKFGGKFPFLPDLQNLYVSGCHFTSFYNTPPLAFQSNCSITDNSPTVLADDTPRWIQYSCGVQVMYVDYVQPATAGGSVSIIGANLVGTVGLSVLQNYTVINDTHAYAYVPSGTGRVFGRIGNGVLSTIFPIIYNEPNVTSIYLNSSFNVTQSIFELSNDVTSLHLYFLYGVYSISFSEPSIPLSLSFHFDVPGTIIQGGTISLGQYNSFSIHGNLTIIDTSIDTAQDSHPGPLIYSDPVPQDISPYPFYASDVQFGIQMSRSIKLVGDAIFFRCNFTGDFKSTSIATIYVYDSVYNSSRMNLSTLPSQTIQIRSCTFSSDVSRPNPESNNQDKRQVMVSPVTIGGSGGTTATFVSVTTAEVHVNDTLFIVTSGDYDSLCLKGTGGNNLSRLFIYNSTMINCTANSFSEVRAISSDIMLAMTTDYNATVSIYNTTVSFETSYKSPILLLFTPISLVRCMWNLSIYNESQVTGAYTCPINQFYISDSTLSSDGFDFTLTTSFRSKNSTINATVDYSTMENVMELEISYSQLSVWPFTTALSASLLSLNLSHNDISLVGNISGISVVDLSYNEITTFPYFSGVSQLDVRGNQISGEYSLTTFLMQVFDLIIRIDFVNDEYAGSLYCLMDTDYPLSRYLPWAESMCDSHFFVVDGTSAYTDGGYFTINGRGLDERISGIRVDNSSFTSEIIYNNGSVAHISIANGPEGQWINGTLYRSVGQSVSIKRSGSSSVSRAFTARRGGTRCPGQFCSACPNGTSYPLNNFAEIVNYISAAPESSCVHVDYAIIVDLAVTNVTRWSYCSTLLRAGLRLNDFNLQRTYVCVPLEDVIPLIDFPLSLSRGVVESLFTYDTIRPLYSGNASQLTPFFTLLDALVRNQLYNYTQPIAISSDYIKLSIEKIARVPELSTAVRVGDTATVVFSREVLSKSPEGFMVVDLLTFNPFAFVNQSIVGQILGVELLDTSLQVVNVSGLNDPVTFTMPLSSPPSSGMTCLHWSQRDESWMPDGCTTLSVSNVSVMCSCNHFTNFTYGVPIQKPSQPSSSINPAVIIVPVVVGSLLLLVLIMAILFVVRRKRRGLEQEFELDSTDMRSYCTLEEESIRVERKNGQVCHGTMKGMTAVTLLRQSGSTREMLSEYQIHKNAHHPNIVQTFGTYYYEFGCHLVVEDTPMGLASDVFKSARYHSLTQENKTSICLQIASAIHYLHSNNIVHGMIRSKSVLLKEQGPHSVIAKLCDFSHASDASREAIVREDVRWQAPEQIEKQKTRTNTDVWSFGIFMWEVFEKGATPFDGMSEKEAIQSICKGVWNDPPSSWTAKNLSVYQRCVIVDEKKRYTAKEITEGLSPQKESPKELDYVPKDRVDIIRMSRQDGKPLIYED
ncbi:tyrosine-protein kinase CSK [Planoprotostelium fungivorum]|uniref:Tyrosine-protein kinase CSK n=1 Tax=Planoprotostelium fungivorum TaxID=1890364 RepID=A0A2P6NT85_9EUKA|nr:tyrosine-protein kinase CSK [Planoprotostelium fungivorum]